MSLRIDQALLCLAADGLSYRCRPQVGEWVAQCPSCRRWSLYLSLTNFEEWWSDQELLERATLVVGCAARCRTPNQIRGWLSQSPRKVYTRRLERENRQLRERLYGLTRSFQRYIDRH